MFILEEAIRAADGLEPLSPTQSRLAILVADSDADTKAIVEAIAFDPALAGALLRYANSAVSASQSPVVTVRDAVIRIGRTSVLSLALGTEVRGRLSEAIPEYGLAEGDLWRSAVLASLAAEVIGARMASPPPQEVGAAALLADIGKMVMHRFLDAETLGWLQEAESTGRTRREAESEVLGVHHGELGGLIAGHWGLPFSIVTGIQYHHTPNESTQPVAYATHLSCMVSGILTDDPDARDRRGAEESVEALGLDLDDIDDLCAVTRDRFEEVQARYQLA